MELVVADIASKSGDLVVEDYGNMNPLVRWIMEMIRPFKQPRICAPEQFAKIYAKSGIGSFSQRGQVLDLFNREY